MWTIGTVAQSSAIRQSHEAATVHAPTGSRIIRLQIDRRESPTFEGRRFGDVGQYEKLVGRAWGELDPADPHNARIVNLDRAPRNARGAVEYSIDVYILKPLDISRGNKTLLYDVVNRGNKPALDTFNMAGGRANEPTKAADAGDGFLMEQGYTVVWSGWQGNVVDGDNRLTAQFPVASQPDGTPIRRWITTEFVLRAPTTTLPISFERDETAVRPYPVVEESMSKARLYRRANQHAPLELISRDSWSFSRCAGNGAATPSHVDVCLPSGFSPNFIYELVYEARDPIVMGMGFAATRDIVSFLRYDTADANPLLWREGSGAGQNAIKWAIGFGSSQSGRYLKDLIYQGFNQDTSGRLVFDGAIPHVSGSRKTFANYAFAMPGRFSTFIENHYYPGDQFPFAYETLTDPISGRVDGVLARCREQGACPKIMHWDSATEYWAGRASLVTTDPLGRIDVPIPENVRVYYFAGTQHGGGTGEPPPRNPQDICQQLTNPNSYRAMQRALLVAMQNWVADGRVPPPSQYPRLSDGTLVPLVPQKAQGFPMIPGVRYTGKVNDLFIVDHITQPPRNLPGTQYTVLVPKVDVDGNEIAGIRSTMLQAPLGTYTGWNLRRAGFIEDEGCYTTGSYVPFAKTAAIRGSDPRASLEERYRTHANYVAQVRAAAQRLRQAGFLLSQDEARLIQEAERRNIGLP